MDLSEQIDAFSEDLEKLLDRYANEFDLPYSVIIGTLQMAVVGLSIEAAMSGGGPENPGSA